MPKRTEPEFTKYHREHLGIFGVLGPYKQCVVDHEIWNQLAVGEIELESYQKMLLHFFPLVENFPKFMGLALAKAASGSPADERAKSWLIGNIKVEQNHALWFRDWAEGIGIPRDTLDSVRPVAPIEAVVHFLWSTNHTGSLAQCLAATNVGIEWATGEWSVNVVSGAERFFESLDAATRRRAMAWLKLHANYDDRHPYEAMELVEVCAKNDDDLEKALHAAKRALEYYAMGLDECLAIEKVA